MEQKQTKERDKIRYKGLGYITFISYVLFNSTLKTQIELVDPSEKNIAFKIDVKQVQFSELASIGEADIDNFVTGKKIEDKEIFPHSIPHQYPDAAFPKDTSLPDSIDWAIFRTEINEVIFRLLELSKTDVKAMFRVEFNGESKAFEEEIDKISKIIMSQCDKIRKAAGKSESYAMYKLVRPVIVQASFLRI